MSNKLRIAILITDTYGEPFEQLRQEFSPVLAAEASRYGIDCYFIKGNIPTKSEYIMERISNRMRYSRLWPLQRVCDALNLLKFNFFLPGISITNENISVNVGEGLRKLGVKVLMGFTCLEKNYDVVIKTTSSSAFNFKKLVAEIENLPLSTGEPIYAGSVIDFNAKKPFVSGANLLLNRIAIQILRKNKRKWKHGELDDVAIGDIMRRNGVPFHKLTTLNIDSVDHLENISQETLENTQHFRCKSSDMPRNDLAILRTLSSRLNYRNTQSV